MLKFLSVSILKKSLRHSLNSYFFTTRVHQMTERQKILRQKALAAHQVIKIISQQPIINLIDSNSSVKYNSNQSFSEFILHKLQEKQFDKEVINEFQAMFDPSKGVNLPNYLKCQKRISDASINSKFVFSPNRLVTTEVFQTLMKFKNKRLIHGPPGISKTTSIILYCYLNRYINQYQFQYEDFSFAKQIPTIFYLSYSTQSYIIDDLDKIKSNLNILEKQIIEKIIENCPSKLSQKLKKIYKDKNQIGLQNIYNIIKNEYNKWNVQYKLLLDQINTFAQFIRKFNYMVKEFQKNKKDKSPFQLSNELNNINKIIRSEYYYWIGSGITFANQNIGYNSSQNLQDSVTSYQESPLFSLNFNHHSPISKTYINYFEKMKFLQGKKEICRILFFQIKKSSRSLQQLQKIIQIEKQIMKKDNFFSSIKTIDLTPISIKQSMQLQFETKNGKITKILQQHFYSNNSVQQVVQNIIQICQDRFIQKSRQSAKYFCEKGNDQQSFQKLFLLFSIRSFMIQFSQDDKRQQFMKFTNKHYGNLILSMDIIDKNLFEVQTNNLEFILTSKLSFDDFLQITSFVEKYLFGKIFNKFDFLFNLLKKMIGDHNSLKGSLIEKFFIYILERYNCSVSFLDQQNLSYTFYINNKNYFDHFYHNKNNMQPLENFFKNILINQKITLGLPQTLNKKESYINKSIDIIIVEPSRKSKFIINSFDLTISLDNGLIKKKQKKIKLLLKQIFDNYNGNPKDKNFEKKNISIIEWRHFIVCKTKNNQKLKVFKTTKKIKKQQVQCEIRHIDIQKFKIEVIKKQQNDSSEHKFIKNIIEWLQTIKEQPIM